LVGTIKVCKNAGEPHTCYRQTKPDIGWRAFENDAKAADIKLTLFNCRYSTILAPGLLLGANSQPGSMAIGNTLMLLMKPATAQGGNTPKFSTQRITKVRQASPSKALRGDLLPQSDL
jgi:hypothetical protein